MRYYKEIDHLIDYFILPLRQIEQVSIARSKIICDVDLINENDDLKEKSQCLILIRLLNF